MTFYGNVCNILFIRFNILHNIPYNIKIPIKVGSLVCAWKDIEIYQKYTFVKILYVHTHFLSTHRTNLPYWLTMVFEIILIRRKLPHFQFYMIYLPFYFLLKKLRLSLLKDYDIEIKILDCFNIVCLCQLNFSSN